MDNGLGDCVAVASVAAMAFPQGLPKKVSQNTNDIKALYKLQSKTHRRVKRIEREHGRRLDGVEGRLGSIEATQGEHSTKLDEILGILRKVP